MATPFNLRWGIFVSVLVSGMLIGGAYLLAKNTAAPTIAEASTETALLQTITTRDSDNDGLPDWEESLYGTDPKKQDTRGLGMTDGEAVRQGLVVPQAVADVPVSTTTSAGVAGAPPGAAPGSLTELFSKNFFTKYLNAKQASGGAALSKDQTSTLVQQVMTELAASIATTPDFKTIRDLSIGASGTDALRAYAVSAERVLAAHTVSLPESELQYFEDLLEKKDESAIEHMRALSAAYRDTATGFSALPVPKELASTMLVLINSMMRTGNTTADFARLNEDPIAAMFALKQYPDAVLTISKAFQDIDTVYKNAHLMLVAGEPGSSFVNVAHNVQVGTASSTKP